ncbi:auxin-responsive protein IAA32-like [Primulina tabacum]|uniref:auxin-responsive protein IAA32-like n=1 Tax=Primulina tabacum TaxID=48773 RepID=UPI003F5A9124
MDSNASSYILPTAYCVNKEDSKLIDLGLSLRALQPDAGYPCAHENYDQILVDWQQLHPHMKRATDLNTHIIKESLNGESSERTQNKQCWTSYVKVSMDGVIVGRKVCIIDHMDYLSLALQLEDMFGKYTISGLRLFEVGSQFSLFYKDIDEQWSTIADVPWKEFVERVQRLRIACYNDEANHIVSSSALVNSI